MYNNINIVAVDFDGTLCEDNYPEIGIPRKSTIKMVKNLKDNGCTIILWTCRCGELLENAIAWCEEQGLVIDYVNENTKENIELYGNDCRKINADVYIDDKAMNIDSAFWSAELIYDKVMARAISQLTIDVQEEKETFGSTQVEPNEFSEEVIAEEEKEQEEQEETGKDKKDKKDKEDKNTEQEDNMYIEV